MPEYLSLYLTSEHFIKSASKQTTGSIILEIRVKDLMNTDVIVPPKEIQRNIAKCINDIDAKLEGNNKINDNLQQLIQATYSFWFNQFEFPDENGKPYVSNGGAFIYNEQLKRNIPTGWTVETLRHNTLFNYIDTGVLPFDNKNYLATANVNGTTITDGEWITFANREGRANMQPSIYSVWFAKMKNSVKHIFIPCNGQWMIDKYIFSTGFSGVQCTEETFAYVACLIHAPFFEKTKDILSHGATQQSVNNDDLDAIKIPVPPQDILRKFALEINPIFNKICILQKENQELYAQREYLLPLLLNGQITIQD